MYQKLKHYTQLKAIESCPPDGLLRTSIVAFHCVHENLDDVQNFVPPAIRNPNRIFPRETVRCEAHALSMFTTEFGLTEFIRKLEKTNKKIKKSLGSHYVQVSIDEHHGCHDSPRSDGHFNFFEEQACDLRAMVIAHRPLP